MGTVEDSLQGVAVSTGSPTRPTSTGAAHQPAPPLPISTVAAREPGTLARLAWTTARFRAMPAREPLERLRQGADARLGRVGSLPAPARRPVAAPGRLLTSERSILLRRKLPEVAAQLVCTARRRAAGEFALLGYPAEVLGRPIAWDLDARSGRRWPRRHGMLTDYRHDPLGDPKWAWELNRLQHIPLLLAAWLVDGDGRLADVAVADLTGWVESDEPGYGIAWANGFEPGLRAMSMALSIDALRSDQDRLAGCFRPVVDSLSRHIAWVEQFPSLHSSANNHRLGELCGVIVADALVPELGARADADRALKELRLRCTEQFAPDGGNREQAFGYAVFATDMLLLAASSLDAAGRRAPGWLDDTLRRSGRALAAQMDEVDPEPRYGDCDDGRCADLDGNSRRTGRALCDALAARFDDDGLARSGEPCASTVWLTGTTAAAATSGSLPQRQSCVLPQTGLVILRTEQTTVMFDCGPHGFPPLYAHAHADTLHVTISHAGVQVIGDPGTGSYQASPDVRDAFRGTGFHATVMVEGRNQGDAAGPFLWSRVPVANLENVDLGRRSAVASHDGYRRLTQAVTHRRSVSLPEDGLVVICDTISGLGGYRVAQRWPQHPDSTVLECHDLTTHATVDGLDVWLRAVASTEAVLSQTTGRNEPFEGWWSDALESVRPATLLSVDSWARHEWWIVTVLSLGPQGQCDVVERSAPDAVGIRRGERSYIVAVGDLSEPTRAV
jgi:hypothetical protein